MRKVRGNPPTPRVDATFIVAKDGDRWIFGASRQVFVSFPSKELAIAHAKKIVSQIPDADFVVVDEDSLADAP